MKCEIYQTGKRIQNGITQLEKSDLSRKNTKILKTFKTELLAEGLSQHRVNALVQSFNTISHLIDFDLQEASREDLLNLVKDINQNNIRDDKNYSVWSLCEYKKGLKRFYQWHTGQNRPERIDFIKTYPKESEKPKVDPEELIKVQEAEEIINTGTNARDKALMGLLWDSGARIGELLSLEWKDIRFNDEVMTVWLREGKNGPRKLFLVESIPLVKKWMNEYPGPCDPEDPVWIALRSGGRSEKRQMTYRAAAKQLRKFSEESSVSDWKRTNPHAWRKARATDMARKGMSQPNMNAYFGWVPGSQKSKFYIRLAERDLERAVRRIYPGVEDLEEEDPDFLGENIPEYDQSDLRAYAE